MKNEMILKIIDTKIAEYKNLPHWIKPTAAMLDLKETLIAEMCRENRYAQERAEYEAHLNRY